MCKITALFGLVLMLTAQTKETAAKNSQSNQVSQSNSNSSANNSSGSVSSSGASSTNGGGAVTIIGDGRYKVARVEGPVTYWSIPVDEEYAKMLLRLGCDVGEKVGELYKKTEVKGKVEWKRVPITCAELQKKK